jgi:hypothetical protein
MELKKTVATLFRRFEYRHIYPGEGRSDSGGISLEMPGASDFHISQGMMKPPNNDRAYTKSNSDLLLSNDCTCFAVFFLQCLNYGSLSFDLPRY